MSCGRRMRGIIWLACAVALASVGCAASSAKSTLHPRQAPIASLDSPAMGLVGLLPMDPWTGPPRAAGMKAVVGGYVVSHPALKTDLSVPGGRDGHALPVLAFKLTMIITEANGSVGPEVYHGHGNLNVFYKPDGFSDALLNYAGAIENTQQIESDKIEFDGNPDFDTSRFYLHVRETVVATRAFIFAGRSWRTPVSRTASDVLVGQYSDSFFGEAFASSNVMPPLSPEEKLIALAGSPLRTFRF